MASSVIMVPPLAACPAGTLLRQPAWQARRASRPAIPARSSLSALRRVLRAASPSSRGGDAADRQARRGQYRALRRLPAQADGRGLRESSARRHRFALPGVDEQSKGVHRPALLADGRDEHEVPHAGGRRADGRPRRRFPPPVMSSISKQSTTMSSSPGVCSRVRRLPRTCILEHRPRAGCSADPEVRACQRPCRSACSRPADRG